MKGNECYDFFRYDMPHLRCFVLFFYHITEANASGYKY